MLSIFLFVRDRLISRALSEGYRSVLPHGVYPAALLFIETPLEEVDVNVHPAKTEVRFRRAAAVADAVRESVRAALASAGYVKPDANDSSAAPVAQSESAVLANAMPASAVVQELATQPRIDFTSLPLDDSALAGGPAIPGESPTVREGSNPVKSPTSSLQIQPFAGTAGVSPATSAPREKPPLSDETSESIAVSTSSVSTSVQLPPLNSADKYAREVTVESLSIDIRPLGQLDESFIIATDNEGLLLDQHVAHERILFDKYRALESTRVAESQHLLIPETFDLTPAQASVFDSVAKELENYGFELMRLSGRTVAIKATPADLPAGEARNMLAEILDTVDAEKKGSARETLRDDIAASLACHAAIKVNMPLTHEKMRWLIDRLLQTSSPTTCPHGRPVILRLATRDILKGFHRI